MSGFCKQQENLFHQLSQVQLFLRLKNKFVQGVLNYCVNSVCALIVYVARNWTRLHRSCANHKCMLMNFLVKLEVLFLDKLVVE